MGWEGRGQCKALEIHEEGCRRDWARRAVGQVAGHPRRIRTSSERLRQGNKASLDGAQWASGQMDLGIHVKKATLSQVTGVQEMWEWGWRPIQSSRVPSVQALVQERLKMRSVFEVSEWTSL